MSNGSVERFIEETRDASPANLLIKFESFSSFAKNAIAQYESRVFEAGGYKWKMIMYPEGYESEKEDCHVSVHFAIVETDSLPVGWKVNAIFAFFVYNHRLDNYLCFRGTTMRFDALVPKRGFTKLISKKTLIDPSKGYLVDDCCQFGAEVFVVKNQLVNECFSLVKETAPFRREFKISAFSKLGYVWNSEEFVFGNHKWKVSVYLNDQLAHTKGRVCIYLKCIDAVKFGPRQKVKAEVRIKNKQNGTHDYFGFNHWVTSSSRCRGFYEFMSIDDMSRKGYLMEDCCFLDVEMCVHAVVLDAPKIYFLWLKIVDPFLFTVFGTYFHASR